MTEQRTRDPKRIIDKYELLEKVGEGGMAVVYRGRHRALDREVAVKLLHPHLSRKERNRIRFEREARAIESLEHEHVLRIYDYSGRDSPDCYIVTEFIHGQTLKDLVVENTQLPSEVVAMIAVHLCEALAYAHERGIIHRDIKPENVMIRDDGVVKLMDFGIARVLDESSVTVTGGLVGSPAYMSPEQATDSELDVRSDVFSMGTLLYYAVTGHLPFSGSSPPIILRNILEGVYRDPVDRAPGIEPGLVVVIRTALATDPANRYQTAEELRRDLGEVLEASEVPYTSEEIQRYSGGPAAYEVWLDEHLGQNLAERGRALLASGNKVSAMKVFNRALYLDEQNQAVRALLPGLRSSGRPISRYLLATLCVLLVPIAAVVALAVGNGEPVRRWVELAGVFSLNSRESEIDRNLSNASEVSRVQVERPDGEAHSGALREGPAGSARAAGGGWAEETPLPDFLAESFSFGPSVTESPGPGDAVEARAGGVSGEAVVGPRREGTKSSEKSGADRSRKTPSGDPIQIARAKMSYPDGAVRLRSATPPQSRPFGDKPGGLAVVNIHSTPYAELFVNGRSYGNTMLRNELISLPPGAYEIRLVNPRCKVYEGRITLKAGQIFERTYQLEPLPAQLTISNLQPKTQVFLDGRSLGHFEGIRQPILIQAPREEHMLKAVRPDGTVAQWSIPKLNHKDQYHVDGGTAVAPAGSP